MNFPLKPRPPGAIDVGGYPPERGYPAREGGGPEEPGFDLRAPLLTLWRRKWVIAATGLVMALLAALVVLQLPHRYLASARVLFEPERLQIIDLNQVLVSRDAPGDGMQNQIEILRSAILLDRVADALALERRPEFNAAERIGPPPPIERFVDRIGVPQALRAGLVRAGLVAPPPVSDADPEIAATRLRAQIINQLQDEMRLRVIPGSRVIEIGYRSTSPAIAAAIVNTVAETYIVVQLEAKVEAVASATELLGGRVRDLEARLKASEEALEAARLEISLEAGQSSALTAQQIQALNGSISGARIRRADLEGRVARIREAREAGRDLSGLSEFRDSPVLSGYQARAAEMRDQVAALRAIVGEAGTNPTLTRLEARLAETERNIDYEVERIAAAIESDLAAAIDAEQALVAELRTLETKALEQSRAELRLQQLQREATADRAIYDAFLARMREISEQSNLQTSDARFLSRASIPARPDTLPRRMVVLLTGGAGLVLGAGLAFLLEMMNATFRRPGEIEARTGLPVLAAIPLAGKRRKPGEVIAQLLQRPNTALAESIRNLRTSILFSNLEQTPKVVMFTSSLPGEAKTTTAMLTAITSRQMGKSAVIVDCDLRRRTLANIFAGKRDRPGLLAALEGRVPLAEAVFEEAASGLHVLTIEPGAPTPANPADMLAAPRFAEMIAELKARYDLVILDTPPVLVVSDARIVARLADAVVYLVRWNHTRRASIAEGLRELGSVQAPIAGMAITLVREAQAAQYIDNDYYYKRSYKGYVSA